ncbi:type I DNA topoisomerase [Patescibacteria group bacterium]
MNLIIVESPTKARTLERFLGKDYQVLATMGHIRDLPKSPLSVDIDNDFLPQYKAVDGKEKVIKQLQGAMKKAKEIYLATDPDREGEAIAHHVVVIGSKSKIKGQRSKKQIKDKKFLRITFHEITKEAIAEALKHPGKLDIKLVNAQQARRVLDRLVGYKLSPLLWRKVRRGLSAGRVQTVAVRLIVEREREIEKFISQEYWEIGCQLRKKLGEKRTDLPTFYARLSQENGKKIEVNNRSRAEEVVAELEKSGYEVDKVVQKETRKNPLPPFITSTLQRAAFSLLRFSSRQTMRLAQGLYEKGLITYHRTDSVILSKEALGKIRQHIKAKYGQEYLPETPRFYKTRSKVAQEAHEAIRPTGFSSVESKITDDREKKLYELIFKRTVACQMKPAVYDQTRIIIRAEGRKNVYLLTTSGRVIKFPGYLVLYNANKTDKDEEKQLPPVKRGDELSLKKVISEQKFTQPPPRYNEASLIKDLEQKGIGRPSTYAPTITTIQTRQYVEKIERALKPTPIGMTTNDFLLEYFPDLFDYQFTAKMEDNLDKIAQGKKQWTKVIGKFYKPFNTKLVAVTEVAQRVKIPTEALGEKCPDCKDGELVIRVGRFGKFISCSRFPDCKYTRRFVEKLEGVKCAKCGGEVVVKRSKKGKRFYGCSTWPKCDWASWRKPR